MKRLSTVLFTLLLICLLCAGARLGYAGEARGVTDDTIKIGFMVIIKRHFFDGFSTN